MLRFKFIFQSEVQPFASEKSLRSSKIGVKIILSRIFPKMESTVRSGDEKYLSYVERLLDVMLTVICPGKVGQKFKWKAISKL